ncbi:hypothetical protein [Bradyrhizobium manausense]|uniref:hypothetical protein n=1 Tax=Bradyrhizobium manausense TaxID=989370 RepID=UPI00070FF54B|nr:hypothetical protein [Bradyrhizobium manausense]
MQQGDAAEVQRLPYASAERQKKSEGRGSRNLATKIARECEVFNGSHQQYALDLTKLNDQELSQQGARCTRSCSRLPPQGPTRRCSLADKRFC